MFLGKLKKKKEPKSVFNSFLYIFTGLAEPNQQDSGGVYKCNYVHDFQGRFSFFKNHTAYGRDIPHFQGLCRNCRCDGSCLPKCHPEQLHKAH